MQQGTRLPKDFEGDNSRLLACNQPDIPPGAHLVTLRRGYMHHGIYAGEGRVVHYAGLSRCWRRGPVEEVSLERFAAGRPILVKRAVHARYSGPEALARARSRLGENRYRITSNNCEHFCEWCIGGTPRSEQVDSLLAWPPLVAMRRFAFFVRRVAGDPMDRPADPCAV
jgi:hypothetical protein